MNENKEAVILVNLPDSETEVVDSKTPRCSEETRLWSGICWGSHF